MRFKAPIVLDSAYNNIGSVWGSVPTLAAMYCKATEGYYTRDPQFAASWAQLRSLQVPRAAYHFYRERWLGLPRDPVPQARFFHSVVTEQGFIPGDKIVLDAEDESGMSIVKVLACGREMRRLFGQWPLLYSGYYKLREMRDFDRLTDTDIADLKQMSLIVAFYPDNPDAFATLPSYLVPDPTYFGPVVGWQYAGDVHDHGFTGVKGSLDFNLFETNFLLNWKKSYLGTTPEPLPIPDPQPDMTGAFALLHQTLSNELGMPTNLHVLKADLTCYDILTDDRLNFMTTDRWLTRNDLDFAVNGPQGWYISQVKRRPLAIADGMAYYHGHGIGKPGRTETLYIDGQNHFSLARPPQIWNACGFPNCLIRNGVREDLSKHSVFDLRARTAFGVDREQRYLYIAVVDGGDYWAKRGMNFQQVQQVMAQLGCHLAVMGDGGGSTTFLTADTLRQPVVIGVPSGEEPRVIRGTTYRMRPVALHFGLRRKK